MAAVWTAQEPPRQDWNEGRGERFIVDVLDENGILVAQAFGTNADVAMRRAMRIERRAA